MQASADERDNEEMRALNARNEQELYLLGAVLLINALIVVLYAVWCLIRRKKESSRSFVMRCVVMLLCPIVGPCFFFFGWVYYIIFFRKPVDLEDVIFSKQRVKTYLKADEDSERNFVPLEEAIAVTDTASTRRLMMEVVRRDIDHSLASISLALESEDSEVSHYAASVLAETLGRLRADFQKQYQRIMELEGELSEQEDADKPMRTEQGRAAAAQIERARHPEEAEPGVGSGGELDGPKQEEPGKPAEFYQEESLRERTKREAYEQGLLARDGQPQEDNSLEARLAEEVELARELLDELHRVLDQKAFSALEQKNYIAMMQEMAVILDRRDALEPLEFEAMVKELMSIGNLEAASRWCERAQLLYPLTLQTFSCRLKLSYAKGDREAFFRALEELKSSGVTLNHETMEMIRAFL